jgi:hypothetical protein
MFSPLGAADGTCVACGTGVAGQTGAGGMSPNVGNEAGAEAIAGICDLGGGAFTGVGGAGRRLLAASCWTILTLIGFLSGITGADSGSSRNSANRTM